jgi:lactate dehydrogenase-like 2-hydroxyacid dehydrogenase
MAENDRTVLILDPLPADIYQEIERRFRVLRASDGDLNSIVERNRDSIVALTSRGKTTIDDNLLAMLPALRIVTAYGVGYDRIDAAAAVRRGVMVTNTPDVLNADVADLAVALLLATLRRLPQADRFVRDGAWMKGAFPLTATLRNRTVGVVGMGRIGQEIAKRLVAFDVALAYHSRNRVHDVAYPHYPDLMEMARIVDTMIVIVPGGKATEKLIDADVLAALGANGVVVNVARGNVVDQAALIRALQDGTILAAGLDVYDGEPVVPDELTAMENVVLLPHIGSGTSETRAAMGRLFLNNLIGWFETGSAATPVRECAGIGWRG